MQKCRCIDDTDRHECDNPREPSKEYRCNVGISASDGANIRLEGRLILGANAVAMLKADNRGSIIADAGFSVIGGATNLHLPSITGSSI
jgi:hypothetical protein